MNAPVRNLCLLFADVSGSTRLYEKLGDAEAMRAVERCLHRMERATVSFKGRVVKHIGDAIMAVFESADAAMHAACEMQQRVDDLPGVSGVKLTIRVGFHFGPALEENNDVFGDTVNTAARISEMAKPGQILASAACIDTLPVYMRASARDLDLQTLKGKGEDVRIYEIIWRKVDELTMTAPRAANPAATAAPARLRLNHLETELLLDNSTPVATLGREVHNDLVINDLRASRNHGRIERRRDKFVLIDQSTNGTYVTPQGENEFLLKHEEFILKGCGLIAFGRSYVPDVSEIVRYEVL